MPPRSCTLLIIFTLLLGTASAHEIQDNRATLVLRDQTHLSVTIYLAYSEALRLALAPQRPMSEFAMVYSTMSTDRLQKELLKAQAKFQATTRIYLAAGRELPVTNWIFPDPVVVQTTLRQMTMLSVVDPSAHAHEEPLEIHADANSPEPVTAIRVQFPEEFQKVLVVAYRPTQLWIEPKTWSPAIRF